MPTDRPIAIIGLMGSGKTTVGAMLAERTGRRFVDNDDLLRTDEGRDARAIAAESGMDSLHARERTTHRRHLAEVRRDPAVVQSLPASVAEWPDRDELLAPYTVVWLDAPAEVLAGRVRSDDHRPLEQDTALRQLRRNAETRSSVYGELADLRVDAAHDAPQDITEQIAAELAH